MNPAAIAAALGKAQREGRGWKCLCPCHTDHEPSLSIIEDGGKILVKCRANCEQALVVAELKKRGLWPNGHDREKPTIDTTYDYADENGRMQFQVCRLSPKSFRQRRPNGVGGWIWNIDGARKVLYRLPDLVAGASRANGTPWRAYIVEGEKDADRLRSWGLTATTNPGGAGKWLPEFNRYFRGSDTVIIGDNDEPGRKHASDVARNLAPVASSVRVVKLGGLLDKGDVSDWIDAGASQSDLETLVETTELFKAGSDAYRLISAADLVAREFKEPKWAVPEIIAEGLAILAGKPKTGKSWAALDFAVAVAGGYCALGNIDCQQGDVLLLALEDNNRRLNQRLKAVLQGQPAPSALQIATEWKRADAGGLDNLADWLKAYPRARLVVIDTLQMIRGQRSRNEGVYADDYTAVGGLKGLADKFGVPFLVVHHLRKEASGDPLESVSGTAGITGSADTILVLKREPKDALALLYVRGRDVIEAEIPLQFDEKTGKWLRLIGADDFRRSRERNAIIRVLLDLGEPMTPAEITTALGKPRTSAGAVRIMLHRMHKAGDVIKHADGRYSASQP